MKKNLLIWISAVILVVIAIYTVKNDQGNKQVTENTKITEQNSSDNKKEQSQEGDSSEKELAPDFTLKDLNGKEVSLKDFKGKNVYLNFWATWCPPCKAEMPEIEKLYQETKDSDLVILAIDIGEDKKTVSDFISENKYSFNVLLDEKNEIANIYGVSSIPLSLFIDKEGYVVNQQVGSMNIEQMKEYVNAFE